MLIFFKSLNDLKPILTGKAGQMELDQVKQLNISLSIEMKQLMNNEFTCLKQGLNEKLKVNESNDILLNEQTRTSYETMKNKIIESIEETKMKSLSRFDKSLQIILAKINQQKETQLKEEKIIQDNLIKIANQIKDPLENIALTVSEPIVASINEFMTIIEKRMKENENIAAIQFTDIVNKLSSIAEKEEFKKDEERPLLEKYFLQVKSLIKKKNKRNHSKNPQPI